MTARRRDRQRQPSLAEVLSAAVPALRKQAAPLLAAGVSLDGLAGLLITEGQSTGCTVCAVEQLDQFAAPLGKEALEEAAELKRQTAPGALRILFYIDGHIGRLRCYSPMSPGGQA